MEPLHEFRQKVGALAASRQEDVALRIDEEPGLTHGALLDVATEIFETRGYRLYKVRVEGATWVASYRHNPRPAGTSASDSSI